jgi:FlaA1/EpsC-like NDP-sugar epimerase
MLAAFLLRFEFTIPVDQEPQLVRGLLLALPIKIIVFLCFRPSILWWRYVGLLDVFKVLQASAASSAIFCIAAMKLIGPQFPRSIYLLDFILSFTGTAAAMFLVRLYDELRAPSTQARTRKKVMIYGAGAAGIAMAREIRTNSALGYTVVGFLDDDVEKLGASFAGLRVLGTGRDGPIITERLRMRGKDVSQIIIAMPSANGQQMHDAVANCRAAGVHCMTIPGLGELLEGKVLSAQLRDVSVTDLLGREPVDIQEERVFESVHGKSIMITGAAGSIGSELCRQVAAYQPRQLVAFDQAESDLFRIEAELRARFPAAKVTAVLGDIRHEATLHETIRNYGVDSIFHAAAYKHVPMMEAYPLEAVINNILGTWKLASAAYAGMVSNFVMISSDKAVNPTSIMGATKRVAELLLSGMPDDRTRFVSVRFGNVLGSNGSVIPTFQAQINAGGPVTVTHPEMRRYFMTIREAVQLVLLASTMGRRSDVFVLDMGEPVNIADLARQMIRLAGLTPEKDIEIRYTGLRPGEKLFEELLLNDETCVPTAHKKLRILKGARADGKRNAEWLNRLRDLADRRDVPGVIAHLKLMVPEYEGAPVKEAAMSALAVA